MKGDIVRLDKLVPEYYVNQSRDFQTLTRLLTVGFNAAKFDSDSVRFENDPSKVSNKMLTLLETKIGFITTKNYLDNYIRKVAQSFYYLIRNKGSMKAIVSCIRLFLQCYNLDTNAYILVRNKEYDNTTGQYTNIYEIRIGVSKNVTDVTLLEDMLRFILPTGYIVTIFFYESQTQLMNLYNDYEVRMVNRFGFDREKVFMYEKVLSSTTYEGSEVTF